MFILDFASCIELSDELWCLNPYSWNSSIYYEYSLVTAKIIEQDYFVHSKDCCSLLTGQFDYLLWVMRILATFVLESTMTTASR